MKFYLMVCLSILATSECFPGSGIPFAIPVKRSYGEESAYQLPSPHADQLHQALRTVKSRSQQDNNDQNSHPVDLLWVPLPKNGKQQHKSPLLPIPISKEMKDSKSPFKIVIVNSDAHSKSSGSLSLEGIERLLAQLEPVSQNVDNLPVQQHHVKIQHVNGGEPKFHSQLPPALFRETATFRTGSRGRDGDVKTENSYSKVQKSFAKHTEHKQKAVYPAEGIPFPTNGYNGQNGASGYRENQQSNADYGNHKAATGYGEQQKGNQYNDNRQKENQYSENRQKEQNNGGYNTQIAASGYGKQQKGNQYSENRQKEQSNGGYSNQKAPSGYGEQQKGNQYSEKRQKEQSNGGYNNQNTASGYDEQQIGSQYKKEQSTATSSYGEQRKNNAYSETTKSEHSGRSYEGKAVTKQNGAGSYVHVEVNSYGGHPHLATEIPRKYESKESTVGQNYGSHGTSFQQNGGSYGKPKPFGKAEVHVTVLEDHKHQQADDKDTQYVQSSSYAPLESSNDEYDTGYQSSPPSTAFGDYNGPEQDVHFDDPLRKLVPILPGIIQTMQSYSHQEHSQTVHEGSEYGSSTPYPPIHVESTSGNYGPPSFQEDYSGYEDSDSSYGQSQSSSGYDHTQSSLGYGIDHSQPSYEEQSSSTSGYESNSGYGHSHSGHGESVSNSGYGQSTESNSGYGHSHSGHGESQSNSGYGQSTESNSGYGHSQSGHEESQSNSGYGHSAESNSGYGHSQSNSDNGHSTDSNSGYGHSHSGHGESPSSSGYGHSAESNSGYGHLHSGHGESQSNSGYGHSTESNSGYGHSQSQSNSGYGHSHSGHGESQSNSGYGHSHSGNGESQSHSNSGYGQSQSNSGHYSKPPRPVYPNEEQVENSQKPPCKHADNIYIARPPISVPEMLPEGPRPVSAAYDKYQGGVQVAPPPPAYPGPPESGPSYRNKDEQNYGSALESAANTVQETYTENKTNGKPFYIVIFQKRKIAKPTY